MKIHEIRKSYAIFRRKSTSRVTPSLKFIPNKCLYPGEHPKELLAEFHSFYSRLGRTYEDYVNNYVRDYIKFAKTRPKHRDSLKNRLINDITREATLAGGEIWNQLPYAEGLSEPMDRCEGPIIIIAPKKKGPRFKNETCFIPPEEVATSPEVLEKFLSPLVYTDIYSQILDTPRNTLNFLAKFGLIANARKCPKCKMDMGLYERNDRPDGYFWKCRAPNCRKKMGIYRGSFFEETKISVQEVITLAYGWSDNLTVKFVSKEMRLSKVTTIDWYNYFRQLCVAYTKDVVSNVKIGGPGCIVEIDESLFCRRKYNKGRRTRQAWVFGGVERGTSNFFAVHVKKRTSEYLIPLIKKYIAPGSVIMSDFWKPYWQLDNNKELSEIFIHGAVNHSKHFVCPTNSLIHTQSIESTWKMAKKKLRGNNGTSKQLFPSYLAEAVFRRQHSGQSIFTNILLLMRTYYDPYDLSRECSRIIREEELVSDDDVESEEESDLEYDSDVEWDVNELN